MKKVIFFVFIFCVSFVFATNLHVGIGQTYATITLAIAASSNNDIITVHEGIYTETVAINKALLLINNTGDSPEISGRIVISSDQDNVTVDGFIIRDGSSHGVYVRRSNRIIIQNCNIYGHNNDGIQVNSAHSSDGTYGNGVQILNNSIHDNNVDGIKIGGQYITIANNYIYDNFTTGDISLSHPDGIQLNAGSADGYTSVQHCKIYNNTVKNSSQLIFLEGSQSGESADCEDIWVYNNIAYLDAGTVRGVTFDDGNLVPLNVKYVKDVYIYNNVLGRAKNYVMRVRGCVDGTVRIRNNIVVNPLGDGWLIEDPADISGDEMTNNCFYVPNGYVVNWGGNYYNSLSGFQSAIGHEDNSIMQNPSLNSDYAPDNINDPVVDIGVAISGFNTDRIGVSRPQGNAWDIGAFEFINNNSSNVGMPENLRIK
jgi:hypothetical protein